MSIRESIAELLFHARLPTLMMPSLKRRILVYGYHRLRSSADGFSTPYDDSVFGPDPQQFRDQLLWLRRHARLLAPEELIELVDSGRQLDRPGALITFDDAYRDTYELALPVLEELAVPAILFVPTGLIDERRLGWWDLIAYVLKRTERRTIELRGDRYLLDVGGRRALTRSLQERMKLAPRDSTDGLVAELSEACGVPLPSAEEQDAELMTWDQVADAARRGLRIGSHCVSHHVLATLDGATQSDELARSRAVLEARIGGEVRSVAYPCGGREHFDADTERRAADAGYQLAFSFGTGVNVCGAISPFDIRRLRAPDRPSLLAVKSVLPAVLYG